jgi:Protein of unknown function (DUF2778)
MWVFEITTGNMYDSNGKLVSKGYAGGNCGKNPEGIDNPDDEGLKNIGPLPEGIYTFGTPVEHSQLGAFAIPLIPDPANNMLGRGGFYLHGDTVQYQAASEGCIIQPRPTRDACWASPDHQLQVVRVFSKVNTAA